MALLRETTDLLRHATPLFRYINHEQTSHFTRKWPAHGLGGYIYV